MFLNFRGLGIAAALLMLVSLNSYAKLTLIYDIKTHPANSSVGQATIRINNTFLRTDYQFNLDQKRSYMTEKWVGRYVIEHSIKTAYLTNYEVIKKHYEPRIKMMAKQMPDITLEQMYRMGENPKYDPSEYIIYKESKGDLLLGHKPADETDIRFRVSTQPTVQGIVPLTKQEFDWLLQRASEDVRFGLSGTRLTHQITELFRRINYQYPKFPYRVVDIDVGLTLELTKLQRGKLTNSELAVTKDYVTHDITQQQIDIFDMMEKKLDSAPLHPNR